MTDEDLAAARAWLRRFQGVDLDPDVLHEPAATAARLSALAGEAGATLPFGAEPSGIRKVPAALADEGDERGR
ncbi:MAG: hypothetical protein ACE5GS_17490 [Kiloniellaceae bacterium]